ncbi:MAG: hypothetical protein JWN48_6089 [Myxococcaceae bacterium]|nr:hypothetical protein [Myxococcaceae bacterium]
MMSKAGRTWGRAWGMSMTLRAHAGALGSAVALSLLAGCAAAPHVALEPLRDVQQKRWFTGPNGMHVELVEFADSTALVQVLGLPSELTGKVLAYQRVQNGERLEYQTKWHGGDLYALVQERDASWHAYIPGSPSGYELSYAEDKSSSIDATAIQRTHQAQQKSGELDALQRFDREAAQKSAEQALAEASASTSETCGKTLAPGIAWGSVSDAQLLDKSVSGYCESILSGLKRLCEATVGKLFVGQHVNAVECALDGDNSLKLEAQKLRWAINFDITNADQRAYAALLALKPDGSQHTLEQQILMERTSVCADLEQKHVVLVGPREAPHKGMAYGDGKQFAFVRTPEQLGEGWFFDPRQRNDQNSEDFRGLDLRLFSHVEPDAKSGTCKLVCGARETSLKLVTGAPKDAILDGASYVASPMEREPYALARDKAGTYYFVDRGVTEQTARDFRLYKGPRGKLRPLPMKDVVADSEGEIFASTSGKLRLVLGKQSAQWIAGSTSTLLLLPLSQNYPLIYNELGVYLRARLGVPCDDLRVISSFG